MREKLYIIILLISISPNILASENKSISGKLRTEFFAVDNYNSNNRQEEFKTYYNRTKLSLKAHLTENLSLNNITRISEMRQNSEDIKRSSSENGSGTRSFENHGVFLDRLYFKYQKNNFNLFAGKKTLNFGQAWQRDNYSWIFNKPLQYYRFDEKFALATALKGGKATGNGKYILTFGTYFNDDKYLDNSIITKRDYINNYTLDSGNDKSLLASYYTSLDINYDFGSKELLSYHFAYVKSAINERRSNLERSQISDQKSYNANIKYKIPITDNIITKIFIEYAFLDNFRGNNLTDAHLLTRYIALNLYQNYSLTYTIYNVKYLELANNGLDESVNKIFLGYQFNKNHILDGFSTYIGYAREKIDEKITNQETEAAILYLKYEIEF